MASAVVTTLTVLLILTVAVAGGIWAHNAGHLGPIIENTRGYLVVKVKSDNVPADEPKKTETQETKALEEEHMGGGAPDAVASVGDAIDVGNGEGELKKRL
ncbi:hypothetical protein BGZ63DRAFT_422679 [Mariannaea sp. PMI_226]|nr:hypothetical protein BGZ63DRAFT_422679 [Mariannaea sp. PMI_226]